MRSRRGGTSTEDASSASFERTDVENPSDEPLLLLVLPLFRVPERVPPWASAPENTFARELCVLLALLLVALGPELPVPRPPPDATGRMRSGSVELLSPCEPGTSILDAVSVTIFALLPLVEPATEDEADDVAAGILWPLATLGEEERCDPADGANRDPRASLTSNMFDVSARIDVSASLDAVLGTLLILSLSGMP